ncbi:MAG: flagellin lysine-N-methylase [Oscillospiraceae bacterium]|nr:flagellin lysine-N-methylase [Oscillospiraceae bacterium]
MRVYAPDYYKDFHCLAGDCKHSCCIGWEIDIDSETLDYYNSVEGQFGQRLRNSISLDETPHFCMAEDERCPFLNEKGLCDIMLELGFDKVSQICDDHPRFRNFYSDRTEIGLGMSCEAVAQQIISLKDKVQLICIEDGEECLWEDEWNFIDLRNDVFECLQNREKTVKDRLDEMLSLCDTEITEYDITYWTDIFITLERLDENWTSMLNQLGENSCIRNCNEEWYTVALEQLAVYFAYRHLADSLDEDNLSARRRFVALSVEFIHWLCMSHHEKNGELKSEDMVEICRMYSAEIEYSPDNMEILLGKLAE